MSVPLLNRTERRRAVDILTLPCFQPPKKACNDPSLQQVQHDNSNTSASQPAGLLTTTHTSSANTQHTRTRCTLMLPESGAQKTMPVRGLQRRKDTERHTGNLLQTTAAACKSAGTKCCLTELGGQNIFIQRRECVSQLMYARYHPATILAPATKSCQTTTNPSAMEGTYPCPSYYLRPKLNRDTCRDFKCRV